MLRENKTLAKISELTVHVYMPCSNSCAEFLSVVLGKGEIKWHSFWGPMEQRVTNTILGNRECIKLGERGTSQYVSGEQGNTHTPAFDKPSMFYVISS